MEATLKHNNKQYQFDFKKPIDLSLPIVHDGTLKSFYIPSPSIEPVSVEGFVGDVNQGGSCNCDVITFTPHGNGTHTEGLGHIAKERTKVSEVIKEYHFIAALITVEPINGQITSSQVSKFQNLLAENPEALIIRTIPNTEAKKTRDYSGSDPVYLSIDTLDYLNSTGVKHLLLDIPSVDKEDDPKLLGHHQFWNYPENPALDKTITEFIYVTNDVQNGLYLLNLQVAAIESDAAPSRPVLFQLREIQE